MKRIFALFVCVLMVFVATSPVEAADMTRKEKKQLLKHLEKSRQLFLDSVEGLTEEQWSFKAGEDRWSIAQCAEHLAVAERFIQDNIGTILDGDMVAEDMRQQARHDDEVLEMIVDRSKTFQAPEPVKPTTRWTNPEEAMAIFEKRRVETVSLVKGGKDLRAYAGEHPGFESLDAYGWFLFLSGHTERHTMQILEVKEAEGYPQN